MSCTDQQLHVGDYGTTFILTVKTKIAGVDTVVDVSSASAKKILFRKPDGTIVSKDATFTTDGTDGKIQYVVESGVIDAVGLWKYRAEVTTASSNYESSTCEIQVYDRWTA